MFKEIIIIIVVVSLVVGLDIITNKYTKDTVESMSTELNMLKEYILKEDKQKAEKELNKVKENWEEKYKVLAFYIEHDELEKVKTELTELYANFSVEEYNLCIQEIETMKFILSHIQEKEEFHLRSIF